MTSKPLTLHAIPFACSLAAHITLREAALEHRIVWARRQLTGGKDEGLREVNPKAKVSTLVLEDGSVVTENVAVLVAIAELSQSPHTQGAAPRSTRLKLYEWLCFVSTELHKQVLAVHFDPLAPEVSKRDVAVRLLPPLLAHPAEALDARPFLLGAEPSVADAYLFWTMLLVPQLGVALDDFPSLTRFREQMMRREAVKDAIAVERRALGSSTDDSHSQAHARKGSQL